MVSKKIDALSSVGTTVVFNVDSADAAFLAKGFKKKVKVEDFIDLEVGQAIVRCGTEIAKIQTLEEAASLLRLRESTLYRHISEGKYSRAVKRGKPIRFWRDRLIQDFMMG